MHVARHFLLNSICSLQLHLLSRSLRAPITRCQPHIVVVADSFVRFSRCTQLYQLLNIGARLTLFCPAKDQETPEKGFPSSLVAQKLKCPPCTVRLPDDPASVQHEASQRRRSVPVAAL
jgi:hypothetical protein